MSKKPVVLVVDDEPNNIRLVLDLLKSTCQVLVATSAMKGLEILSKNNEIELVLLDIMMPEMSGIEMMQQMQNTAALTKVPVVFLTANAQSQSYWDGLNLGAKDYILKPIVPEVLWARVNHLLNL